MPNSFREFKQFVNDKDKGKAPVKQIADYPGPHEDRPPSGGAPYAPKASKGKKLQGATGAGGKAINGGKIGSDWTSTGDKDLVYNPAGKTGVARSDYTFVPKKLPKTKGFLTVKEFVEKTKDMSAKDFARYLAENNTNSGEVHDNIHQTVQILCENPHNTGDLVRELKRNGLLESTVAAALNHPEGYRTVARLMEDYEFCRKVVKSMDEMVGPPMHRHAHIHPNMGDQGMMGDPNAMPPTDPSMGGGMPGQPNMDDPSLDGGDSEIDLNDPDMGDDEPDEFDMDDDDPMLHHGSDPDDSDDDFGLDDEDQDSMGGDDMGMDAAPANGDPSPDTPHLRHHMHRKPGMNPGQPPMPGDDQPAPSMMAKLMRRENASPAASNLLRALRG